MQANVTYWIVAQTGKVVPLAYDIPGTGKTQSVLAFARALQRRVYVLIGSIREPADVGGYPQLVRTPDGEAYMRLVPPKWALDCCGEDSIVFIDEVTTCPPAVQAAFLAIMAEKRVGDLQLPESTLIVAAANPPETAANGYDIEPALANRFWHWNWEHDNKRWLRGMSDGMAFGPPEFPRLPDDWEKHAPSAGNKIAAFLRSHPDLIAKYPTDDRKQASRAWPSHRSWTNAAWCRAAVESVGGDSAARFQAIEGCVGWAAAHEFETWEKTLDLEDPEVLLSRAIERRRNGKPIKWRLPERADQVMVALGALADRVINHGCTPERWLAAMSLYEVAMDKHAEIVACYVSRLWDAQPTGVEIPDSLLERLYRLEVDAGILPELV